MPSPDPGVGMKRHVTTSGKASRARRDKPATPQRRTANAVARRKGSLVTDLQDQVRSLTDELTEARHKQTATSEMLKVISSSPGDLQPVFQAMLENAARVCEAKFGVLFRYGEGAFHAAATLDVPPAYAGFLSRGSFHPEKEPALAGSPLHRLLLSKDVVRIDDHMADPNPGPSSVFGGAQSSIAVPLLKDDELVGAFVIYRTEVRPFTDKQVELVQNFAAQAVIAIENTRLLKELRQRTDDLSESLEQQTATSEVLKVISSSPGALEPVFTAMLENAVQLCDAKFGILNLYEGGAFRHVAMHNVPPAYAAIREGTVVRPHPGGMLDWVVKAKESMHVEDVHELQPYRDGNPNARALGDLGGARTMVTVPMLKDEELIGALAIYRQEVRPFTGKQVDLLQNFAAQAVIAIENTRLLSELRQTLERQTATSEVLSVISRSPGNLQPVFQAMLENACRICEAKFGVLFDYNEQGALPVAWVTLPTAFEEYLRQRERREPRPGSDLDQLITSKQIVHTADMLVAHHSVPSASLGGARTELAVPLLKDHDLVGAISIYRQEVRPFTDKQIELVQNFAAQAVIAIENTRLLNELREVT